MLTMRYSNILKPAVNTARYNRLRRQEALRKLRVQFFVVKPRLVKVRES